MAETQPHPGHGAMFYERIEMNPDIIPRLMEYLSRGTFWQLAKSYNPDLSGTFCPALDFKQEAPFISHRYLCFQLFCIEDRDRGRLYREPRWNKICKGSRPWGHPLGKTFRYDQDFQKRKANIFLVILGNMNINSASNLYFFFSRQSFQYARFKRIYHQESHLCQRLWWYNKAMVLPVVEVVLYKSGTPTY